MPYVLKACPINKAQEKSLEFTINKVLTKVFCTKSTDVVQQCRLYFGITDVSHELTNVGQNSSQNRVDENGLCHLLVNVTGC